jgi:2'-5' RNA ligase
MTEVPPHERRTALLVQVPVAEAVDDFRRRHLAASVARGIPAHVTVLFPFAGPASIDAGLRAQVVEHFATFSAFSAELARVDRFDAHVWLAPEPHERFIALLAGTHARFPQLPPYGDAFAEPVPHLTIGEIGPDENVEQLSEQAERELGAGLPFDFAVRRISLFEELADGRWQQSDSFELG